MTTTNEINRETFDNIRVSIEDGIVYRGLYAVNRKPLQSHEVALVAGVVALCDADELKDAIIFARKLDTPGEIWAALEAKKNPPPKPVRRPRRGEVRSVRYNWTTGVIVRELW